MDKDGRFYVVAEQIKTVKLNYQIRSEPKMKKLSRLRPM